MRLFRLFLLYLLFLPIWLVGFAFQIVLLLFNSGRSAASFVVACFVNWRLP